MLSAAAAAEMLADDQLSVVETASSSGSVTDNDSSFLPNGGAETSINPVLPASPCDACPDCDDRCRSDGCQQCASKQPRDRLLRRNGQSALPCSTGSQRPLSTRAGERFYTLCQVRRHDHEGSCWIVAGDAVYDVTPILESHPGGGQCLLRKAGGNGDCTVDFKFHSRSGREKWKTYRIGTLRDCGNDPKSESKPWWGLW